MTYSQFLSKFALTLAILALPALIQPRQSLADTASSSPETTTQSAGEPSPDAQQTDQSSAEPAESGSSEMALTPSDVNPKNIARAQFTSAVVNHEPADDLTSAGNGSNKLYFFTELVNLKGSTITHRWEYQGKTMAEVNFNVGSNRWRVYSIKTIKPEWTGTWTVDILDDQGKLITENKLEVENEGNMTENVTEENKMQESNQTTDN